MLLAFSSLSSSGGAVACEEEVAAPGEATRIRGSGFGGKQGGVGDPSIEVPPPPPFILKSHKSFHKKKKKYYYQYVKLLKGTLPFKKVGRSLNYPTMRSIDSEFIRAYPFSHQSLIYPKRSMMNVKSEPNDERTKNR